VAKGKVKLIIGQIASSLPSWENLKQFDLIITSFPHYVKLFESKGIASGYLKIGFDPRVLKKVGLFPRKYGVVFVGSITPGHNAGTKALEKLASRIPLHVWGQGVEYLSPVSPLRKNHHGPAWGFDMFQILAQSKIVVNRHVSVADGFANNMRLYESTGMGAMLITDYKKNLGDLFRIGSEVEAYSSIPELVEKVEYYLRHDSERETIAKAGQKRTLEDHSYLDRMRSLVSMVEPLL